jgi:O-antigen ligase
MSSQMSAPASTTSRSIDPIGLTVLLVAGLNLNGAFLFFLGTEGLLSPLILLLTSVLCVKYARADRVARIYVLFVLAVLSYLVFALLAGIPTANYDSGYILSYSATIVLVSAIYFWLVSISEAALKRVLIILKYTLLISCLLIMLSDALRPFRSLPPVDESQLMQMLDTLSAPQAVERAAGFFGNPNEAATVALYCIVLIVTMPSQNVYFRTLQCALAVTALVMTFSKAGMLTLLVLVTLFLLTRKSFLTILLTAVVIIGVFSALWYIFDQDILSLSTEQRERLSDVLNLAGGDFNERSTTGRNILLDFGYEKIKETFPWGSGLGQFHAMEGGVRKVAGWFELDEWLGIHNTFLMILGEAGVVPLVILLAFLFSVLARGVRARHRDIIVGFTVILCADMLVAHHVLLLRVTNIAVAIILVLIVLSPRARSLKDSAEQVRASRSGRSGNQKPIRA